jgi:chlorobactene glucosyltransferase
LDLLLEGVLLFDSLVGLGWILLLAYNARELATYPDFSLKLDGGGSRQKVSVIVPARNEESDLPRCLESILNQTQRDLDVVVVDDLSEDGTRNVVQRFAELDTRVRLIQGEQLPPGWVGKNWACHQGYLSSKGDWLLFIDADTSMDPRLLSSALGYAEGNKLGALSIFPAVALRGFWAKAVWPVVSATIRALYPLRGVADPRGRSAVAFGAFILIERKSYGKAGGHEATKSDFVEDKQLSANLKASGVPYRVLLGGGALVAGLASGLGGTWNSIRRISSNPTRGNRLVGVGFFVAGAALFIFPLAAFAFSLAASSVQLTECVVALISVVSPAAIASFDVANCRGTSRAYSLLSLLGGAFMALGVLREVARPSGFSWRGRTYIHAQAPMR